MAKRVEDTPRLSRGLFYIGVIGLVIVGIAGFIFVQRGSDSAVNIATGAPKPLPVNVGRVGFVDTLEIAEQYTGLVAARRTSSLGFEAGGRVESLRVDVGDTVQEGTVLAKLDTRTLSANLAAATAQIGEAEAALKIAQTTVSRQKILAEKGLLSGQSFDEADAQALAAEARLTAAKAQRDALRVRIDQASLKAPFEGMITKRFLDEGAIASPGQPVFQLVENSALETTIGVPAKLARRLQPGETYQLIVDQQKIPAELRSVTGVIDASQRTVTAVFDIDAASAVFSGAVARLELREKLEQSGTWIPVSAMTEADRGLWSIYVAHKTDGDDYRVEKRLVDIIHAEADKVFVRGALSEGEYFVKDGLHRLTPDQRVTLKFDDANAAEAG